MRWKTTLCVLVATIGVGAYISLYEIRQPSREERELLAREVVNLPPEGVTQLVLDLPEAKVTLTKADGRWMISPQRFRADPALIDRLLSALSPLTAERTLTGSAERPLDWKTYGLDPAVGWMSAVANGTTTTLRIGEATAVTNNRYVQVAGRPEIFIVPAGFFEEADKPFESFRDPQLVRVDAWAAKRLTVASAASTYTVERRDDRWVVTQPVADQADRTQVNNLLRDVSSVDIKRFLNDAPPVEQLATWGFDQPKAEIALLADEAPAAPVTLFIGKPLPDDASLLYAKRSDEPSLYAVAQADVDMILRDPHGLRAKACVEFFLSDVTKIEVSREGTSWRLERVAGRWREAGTETVLDADRVEKFLNDMANLRLSGFVDDAPSDLARYGLEPPWGTLAVWTSKTGADQPQRMLVGTEIEGSDNRYGRIEGRTAVVRLPDLVTTLLAKTPDQLRAPPTEPGHPATGGVGEGSAETRSVRPTEPGHPPEVGGRGSPAAEGGGAAPSSGQSP